MTSDKSSTIREPVHVTEERSPSPKPLINSPAEAEREFAVLRRGREAMIESPLERDTSARATLF